VTPPTYDTPPTTASAIRARLKNVYGIDHTLAIRRTRTIASVAVAQMLPQSVVKGGGSMNLRRGPQDSRVSLDLDVSRPIGVSASDFLKELEANLKRGWNGFNGTLTEKPKVAPNNVPPQYVMQPVDVHVTYKGSTFEKVPLEISREEFDVEIENIDVVADEIVALFTNIGLGAPEAVTVLSVELQAVQKLHACTTPTGRGRYERAHDLVDLQLLCRGTAVNLSNLDLLGRCLFRFRKQGAWPPTVAAHAGWETLYGEASEGLDVLPLAEAITWINALTAEAVRAGLADPS
jgi:hypothetical protein